MLLRIEKEHLPTLTTISLAATLPVEAAVIDASCNSTTGAVTVRRVGVKSEDQRHWLRWRWEASICQGNLVRGSHPKPFLSGRN